MVQDMEANGFPVTVHVFESCPHGYCAYRYPNGHQALYWFSKRFKRNATAMGINQGLDSGMASKGSISEEVEERQGLPGKQTALPGLW
jgi:hypothetical protein